MGPYRPGGLSDRPRTIAGPAGATATVIIGRDLRCRRVRCADDAHACGGACFSLNDPSHCTALCRSCGPDQTCVNGHCVCPDGTVCDGDECTPPERMTCCGGTCCVNQDVCSGATETCVEAGVCAACDPIGSPCSDVCCSGACCASTDEGRQARRGPLVCCCPPGTEFSFSTHSCQPPGEPLP